MNIAFADKPLLMGASSWITDGVLTDFPEGKVVVTPRGNLGVGPDGNFQYSQNRGPYELCTVDPQVNVLHFTQNGCPMAVAYCAR